MDYTKNPKYGEIEYSDPRNDEVWTQRRLYLTDVIEDLLTRIEKLENKEN